MWQNKPSLCGPVPWLLLSSSAACSSPAPAPRLCASRTVTETQARAACGLSSCAPALLFPELAGGLSPPCSAFSRLHSDPSLPGFKAQLRPNSGETEARLTNMSTCPGHQKPPLPECPFRSDSWALEGLAGRNESGCKAAGVGSGSQLEAVSPPVGKETSGRLGRLASRGSGGADVRAHRTDWKGTKLSKENNI